MAKGASSRSGPAPDPLALRRDRDGDGWVALPAAGREGDAPAWPLSEPTERELLLWAGEWVRPQAVMWERNGQELEVALYVRALTDAEVLGASAATRTLVLRLQEALGLSLPGLARNRWRIEESLAVAGDRPSRSAGRSVRERFQVVTGGAA